MARRRRKQARLPADPVEVRIESLSHDGRGIVHINDKVVFIDGALAGEKVLFQYISTRRNYDEGKVVEVLEASPDRVEANCDFFALCGGCSLQHMAADKQIEMKQSVLIDLLKRTSQLEPASILPPLTADVWAYRSKARLGVKYVRKKERVLVGFREKHSPFLADMQSCEVLDSRLGHKLGLIADVIQGLEARDKIAQIEVAITEDIVGLVFRNLVELSESDRQKLIEMGASEGFHIYLQPGGPDSIYLIHPGTSELTYRLPDYQLELVFLPTDFTQVNTSINRKMINQALSLLQLQEDDHVLDLFCGLGNFTLPIANQVASVTGVEGDTGLIERAKANASRNNIGNASFYVHDLTKPVEGTEWGQQTYNKVLIDPARPGALEVMELIASMRPERIVYVSCNPATLARDAGELVNTYGYKLECCGVMDMFPHTAHVESMALFVK